MTKQDFVALADALRPVLGELTPAVLDRILSFCAGRNGRFNATLFRAYLRGECGPSGGRIKPGRRAAV